MKPLFDTSSLPLLTQLTIQRLFEGKTTPERVVDTTYRRKRDGHLEEAAELNMALMAYRVQETYIQLMEEEKNECLKTK